MAKEGKSVTKQWLIGRAGKELYKIYYNMQKQSIFLDEESERPGSSDQLCFYDVDDEKYIDQFLLVTKSDST